MFRELIEWTCWKLVEKFPTRHRVVEIDGDPYLLRFYIKRNGIFPGIYLHHFYRGDADRDLHNHPWKLSASLILTGGYVEEYLKSDYTRSFGHHVVLCKDVKPGRINVIRANHFHRVELLDGPAWTLFVSGKQVQDWGFWDIQTGAFVPHRKYLAEKGRPVGDEWEND